jgi:phosphatidylserine/phosphatidylglycerophosphate/cardiolipin synthase-like enzyme
MPKKTSVSGSELFIVDNSETDWKVVRYLHDWCDISKGFDIATGYFEIGALLSLKEEWQKVDKIRILMGDEVSLRTNAAFSAGLQDIKQRLDDSLEDEKAKNDFLVGVAAIVEALKSGKIECRVYKKEKFHAKCYITHARKDVIGAAALVGSSNFTFPGLNENIELNVQITGSQVAVLQEWYEDHWEKGEVGGGTGNLGNDMEGRGRRGQVVPLRPRHRHHRRRSSCHLAAHQVRRGDAANHLDRAGDARGGAGQGREAHQEHCSQVHAGAHRRQARA